MGTTISLLNQKGGVGKTSSCHHLAGTLAKAGRRVLLIDNDPQASLSQGFWGPEETRRIGRAEGVAALYDDALAPIPEVLIRPTGFDGVAIVPGSRHLTPFNMLPPERWHDSERGIREFLAEVRDDFDLTLIDCPPNLHLCSWAALVASDFLIVPLAPEDYGAQGIIDVQESVMMVQAGPNPGLRMLGYLLTMMNVRKTIHQLYEESLREQYDPLVFATRVAEAVEYVEALNRRIPVAQYKPKGAAAKTMKALADEIQGRLIHGVSGGESQEAA
jgi:chromosome partitioning protein